MTPDLNPEQQTAVSTALPHTLVVAGPGSGKTRVLVARIEELLRRKVPACSIVAITYTNAAADEIQKRLCEGVTYMGETPWGAPIPVPEHTDVKLGYCGTLHGYALRLLERNGKVVVMDEETAEKAFREHAEKLNYKGTWTVLDQVKREKLNSATATSDRPQRAELVVTSWFGEMLRSSVFDFDGLLYWGLELIKRGQHAMRIHLLVDEAQDMAPIDAQFYAALDCLSRFFLGDPDQSIYGFRGADVQQFLGLARSQCWSVLPLQWNYRSGPDICDTANSLILRNQQRVHKRCLPIRQDDCAVETWSGLATAAQEQAALAMDLRKQPDPNQCAVLLRTNALVDEYTRSLLSYSIPVVRRAERDKPPDWQRCKIVLAALANPSNDYLMFRLIKAVRGETTAQRLKYEAAEARRGLCDFTRIIPATVPVADAADWLVRCGVEVESIALVKRALSRVQSVGEALLLLAQEERAASETGEGVTVCTMHSAKGREWDAVYLPAFEQDVIPGKRSGVDIEEERRLAFVAVTRAKRRLVVSWVNMRKPNKFSETAPAEQSQFVREMEDRV